MEIHVEDICFHRKKVGYQVNVQDVMHAYKIIKRLEGWVYNKPVPLLDLGHVWSCIEKLFEKM